MFIAEQQFQVFLCVRQQHMLKVGTNAINANATVADINPKTMFKSEIKETRKTSK